MTNHAQVTSTALVISDTTIHQDSAGLYSLNDLHKAAGNDAKHQPAFFMRREETKALIAEIQNSADSQSLAVATNRGRKGGTYVCWELVYSYGMWISAAFHLKVIRAYDAAIQQATQPPALPAPVDELPEEVRAAIARKAHALAMEGFEQIRARLEQRAREQLPYSSPKEFLLWLNEIGGPDAELIVLNAHELWDITSMVAVAHRGIGNALAAIHNLEAKTGRWWHGRPDAD